MSTIISHKKKIIFFHIPKTGGTILSQEIIEHDKSFFYIQASLPNYSIFDGAVKINERLLNSVGLDLKDYIKFTVIRHPIDRLWSSYQMMSPNIDFVDFVDCVIDARLPYILYTRYDSLYRSQYQDFIWHSHISQYNHCINHRNNFSIDHIISFENLKSDVENFSRQYGLSSKISKNLKNSVYANYKNNSTISVEVEDKIKSFFKQDFSFFVGF